MKREAMTPTERADLAMQIAALANPPGQSQACGCRQEDDPAQRTGSGDWPDARALDLSLTRADPTPAEVERFLQACRAGGFRSAWVPPRWASLAVLVLKGSSTAASSGISCPHGTSLTPVKCAEAELLMRLGVRQLWMVADTSALRSGDLDAAFVDIRAVAQLAECGHARLTVALPLPSLSERRAAEACAVAKLAGAQAVATALAQQVPRPEDVARVRRSVGLDLEVVASGEIREAGQARALLEAGADRVATSHRLGSAVSD